MPIKEINKNIKKLQNESFNCSKLIIQLRVENLDDLKSKKKLFYLESQSKKIIEKLKILNLKKNIIKK